MFWNSDSSDEKRRALAMGGPLAKWHSESFERLKSRYSTSPIRKLLAQWWNVIDRKSAIANRDWLMNAGHSREAVGVVQGLFGASSISCENPEGRVAVALANRAVIEKSGLVAWDKGRLVSVARWCVAAGYISRDEGWDWVLQAAGVIECAYGSWEEFGAGWALGYQYWSSGKIDATFQSHLDWLLKDASSPWNILPWSSRQ